MTPNEARPRREETLSAWIARIEPALARVLSEEQPPADMHAAYRVGVASGSWGVLHQCFECLGRDVRDPERLLMAVLAGQLALSKRRHVGAIVSEFLDGLDRPNEGGPDGSR